MLHLPDLPLELFNEIIHSFVCDVGFAGAVQARYACRSFDHAILQDICSNFPISKFRELSLHRRGRLVASIMPDVLFNIKPTNCRSRYLHDHTDAVIEYMHLHFPHVSINRRDIYKKQLSNAIAAALHCETIINLLLHGPIGKSITIRKNMARADTVGMLAAAAAVGNLNALIFLISKVRTARTRSKIFGQPLLAAAVNGQVQAAAYIFHHIQHEDSCAAHLWYIIITCIEKRCTIMLPTLLIWFYRLDLDGETIESTKRYCIEWASQTGNLDVLQICHVPYTYNPSRRRHTRKQCRQPYKDFENACRCGHEDIVRFYMSLEPPRKCRHSPAQGFLDIGLHVAAKCGRLVVAKFLLDSGARVNELVAVDRRGALTALARAVQGNHVDVVVLLLAYGARVRVKNPHSSKLDTEQLACMQGGAMRRIIREAKKDEMAQHGQV